MTSSTLLRAARGAGGLSQRALADKAGIPQPRIADIEAGAHDTTVGRLEELLAPLGQRITFLPSERRPVWEAAVAVADAVADADERRAWREVIQLSDDLNASDGAVRVALSVAEPPPTGDLRYDALIAGVVDHWLSRGRLPRPTWVRAPERTLEPAWDVEPLPELRAAARETTPRAFARHGVFVAASEFESV